MSFEWIAWQTFLLSGPLLLMAMGGAVGRMAGESNEGLEGISLLAGACVVLLAPVLPQWPLLWVLGGILGMLLGGVIALCLRMGGRPSVTGMGINLCAWGILMLLMEGLHGTDPALSWARGALALARLEIPAWLPVLGGVGAVLLVVVGVAVYDQSPWGLRLRAVQSDAWSAARLPLPVMRYRIFSQILSGGLCGLGGALVVLTGTPRLPMVGLGYAAMVLAALCGRRLQWILPEGLTMALSAAVLLGQTEISLPGLMTTAPAWVQLAVLGGALLLCASLGVWRRRLRR